MEDNAPCQESLSGTPAERAEAADAVSVDEVLGEIAVGVTMIADIRESLNRLVVMARQDGATWERIGAAAGVSRQAAHERWSKVVNSTALSCIALARREEVVGSTDSVNRIPD
jgi:hypothetical protein